MGKKGYGSAFGEAQRTCYFYIDFLKRNFDRQINTLVIDALDGIHVLPFARRGINVDCYETNNILINGGIIDGFKITGLLNKNKYFNLNDFVNIHNKNFYKNAVESKYDFVYVYRSLHLDRNKEVPIDKKIKKILTSVKDGGYVYILYHLAVKDNDYINYPKSQYLRPGEMSKYFDYRWKILDNHERNKLTIHNAHPFNSIDHKHRVGYIFAQKRRYYKKKIYNYNFEVFYDGTDDMED